MYLLFFEIYEQYSEYVIVTHYEYNMSTRVHDTHGVRGVFKPDPYRVYKLK